MTEHTSVYRSGEVEIPKEIEIDGIDYSEYLLNKAVEFIGVVNTENEVIVANQRLSEITGYSRDELMGSHPAKFLSNEGFERGRAEVFKLITGEKSTGSLIRLEFETKSGDLVPLEVKYSLLPNQEENGYNGVVFIGRDIREKKRREQKLQVMSRVLRHNLRNEMSVILGHAELFKNSDDPSLEQAARSVEERTNDLLQMGEKIRKVQEEVQATPAVSYDTELTRLANTVIEDFDSRFGYVDMELTTPDGEVRANTPPVYRTAVEELVENAIEHCEKGVAAEVLVEIEIEDESVVTKVRDVNDSIPEQELEVIHSGEETDLMHGSGIGLWLANWIVETAGGKLEFDRYEGDGRSGNRATIYLDKISAEIY